MNVKKNLSSYEVFSAQLMVAFGVTLFSLSSLAVMGADLSSGVPQIEAKEAKILVAQARPPLPSDREMRQDGSAARLRAAEAEEAAVPRKATARIASIQSVGPSNLKTYLQKTLATVALKIEPKFKVDADKRLVEESSKGPGANAVAAAALGLWIGNQVEVALYLMGGAVLIDLADANNLNNYAAFLVMAGGEDLAVPLLNTLNAEYPGNCTVLNNLGQAWFGLGDIDKADNFLNQCLAKTSSHSQANSTKAYIEASRGNRQAAIDALKKSIKQAYSFDKDNRLSTLGYTLNDQEISWRLPRKDDGLGLGRFNPPSRPKTVAESAEYEMEWQAYKEALNLEREKLFRIKSEQSKVVQASFEKIQRLVSSDPRSAAAMLTGGGLLKGKATRKLSLLTDQNIRRELELRAELNNTASQVEALRTLLDRQVAALEKKYDRQFGEGRRNPVREFCKAENAARNVFLEKSNDLWNETFAVVAKQKRNSLNDELNYQRFSLRSEAEFEQSKTEVKLQWLNLLVSAPVEFQGFGAMCPEREEPTVEKHKLAEWEELHCPSAASLEIYDAGTMFFGCTRAGFELAPLGAPVEVTFRTNYRKGTGALEFLVGADKGFKTAGPVEAGLSLEAKGGGFIEWDSSGISDVGVIGKIGVSAEATAKLPSGFDTDSDGNEVKLGISLVEGSVRVGVTAGAKADIKSILSGH
jgi:hypothetical protein